MAGAAGLRAARGRARAPAAFRAFNAVDVGGVPHGALGRVWRAGGNVQRGGGLHCGVRRRACGRPGRVVLVLLQSAARLDGTHGGAEGRVQAGERCAGNPPVAVADFCLRGAARGVAVMAAMRWGEAGLSKTAAYLPGARTGVTARAYVRDGCSGEDAFVNL